MTVNSISAALDLMEEIGFGSVGYAYRRRTGQTLYAVFTDKNHNDLDSSPDVIGYIPIDYSYRADSNAHDNIVNVLDSLCR